MDLLDFKPGSMYFDEPLDLRVEVLILEAAMAYGAPKAEVKLRQAETLAPEHLSVLVALYRYYFYRHQHDAALAVASRAMEVGARRLNFTPLWQAERGELVRFYLHALKGAGYLCLRLGDIEAGLQRLDHVAALDIKDRIGAKALADVARQALQASAA